MFFCSEDGESLHTEGGERIVHTVTARPARAFVVRRCENVEHHTWSQRSETMEIASSLWVQHWQFRLWRYHFVGNQFRQPCCYKQLQRNLYIINHTNEPKLDTHMNELKVLNKRSDHDYDHDQAQYFLGFMLLTE